MKIVLEFVSN